MKRIAKEAKAAAADKALPPGWIIIGEFIEVDAGISGAGLWRIPSVPSFLVFDRRDVSGSE